MLLLASNGQTEAAASCVGLGTAQQGVPDLLRMHLDETWEEPRVWGLVVSGNPLEEVTSVIQFDNLSHGYGLTVPMHWEGAGLDGEQWILPALL